MNSDSHLVYFSQMELLMDKANINDLLNLHKYLRLEKIKKNFFFNIFF